jgi:membrane fusion protein (multidrug efflux system)
LSDSKETESVTVQRKQGMKRTHRAVLIAGGIIIVIAAVAYYLHSRSFESTDNAFVEGGIIQISPRVAGQVVRVYVTDNQRVQQGDLLVEIDSRDYALRVAEAKARLADAEARFSSARSGVALTSDVTSAALNQATAAFNAAGNQTEILSAHLQQQDADIQAAEATLRQAEAGRLASEAVAQRAQADVVRYRNLFQKDEVSKQTLDRAEADGKASAASLDAATHAVTSAQARLEQSKAARASTLSALRQAENLVKQASGKLQEARAGSSQVRIRESEVKSAQAQIAQLSSMIQQAELNLSFTKVYATEAGTITRKSVEPGNFVQVGQSLMAIVTDRLWVVANFKETQLTYMKPGQEVDIRVDAYPQHKLKGKVDSIQTGTGARFSLLPAENATGNYVKVIQRMPVKITFVDRPPAAIRLGPGMSVVPTVRVR